jgi:ribose-phosphate pyrophosphokinase
VTRILFNLNGHENIAAAICQQSQASMGDYARRQFPDGETYLRVDSPVRGADVILLCGLEQPDDKFLPLLFLSRQLKQMGARSVGLVTPYLAYMRQDRRFMDGEALTSRHFAELLSNHVDWLVTVDPHLHRYHSLDEIYSVPSRVLHAAPLLAQFVRDEGDVWLLGPDEESAQWVSVMAETAGVPWAVARKERFGDRDVRVTLPDTSAFAGRRAMLVDDVISSGHTMQRALLALKAQGFEGSDCLCIHGLFADGCDVMLKEAGAARLISCNSILHPSNRVDLGPVIAEAVSSLLEEL